WGALSGAIAAGVTSLVDRRYEPPPAIQQRFGSVTRKHDRLNVAIGRFELEQRLPALFVDPPPTVLTVAAGRPAGRAGHVDGNGAGGAKRIAAVGGEHEHALAVVAARAAARVAAELHELLIVQPLDPRPRQHAVRLWRPWRRRRSACL